MLERSDLLLNLVVACTPILVALIGIIPTIISNRKKTQDSIEALKVEIGKNNETLMNDVKKSHDDLRDELKADSAETKEKVGNIEKQLMEHIAEGEQEQIKTTRYRILRFYDELCEGREHSESHFEDILEDIDEYEEYCQEHPMFKNNRCKAASAYIQQIFHKIKAKGGFLAHTTEEV